MRWILFPAIGYVDLHYLYHDVLLLAQLAGGATAPAPAAAAGSSSLTTVLVLAGLATTMGLLAWQRLRGGRSARA